MTNILRLLCIISLLLCTSTYAQEGNQGNDDGDNDTPSPTPGGTGAFEVGTSFQITLSPTPFVTPLPGRGLQPTESPTLKPTENPTEEDKFKDFGNDYDGENKGSGGFIGLPGVDVGAPPSDGTEVVNKQQINDDGTDAPTPDPNNEKPTGVSVPNPAPLPGNAAMGVDIGALSFGIAVLGSMIAMTLC